MDSCCAAKEDDLRPLRKRQRGVLIAVLVINAAMFVVELVGGLAAGSSALLADSLDMLGDASVYGLTLFVLERGARWRSGAALLKGGVMAAFAVGVLVTAVVHAIAGGTPRAEGMGLIALLALVANASCLVLLTRHRADDLNMRSTWLCSRNDILANLGVLAAAGGVALTGSGWPDVAIGVAIAGVVARSAWSVIAAAMRDLAAVRPA